MLLPLLTAVLLAAPQARDSTLPADTAKKHQRSVNITIRTGARDSGGVHVERSDSAARAARIAAKRIPVTPALLASAYRTPETRALVLRAREARLAVDSTLRSYQAIAYQRMSAGFALRALARQRLAARQEQSAKVSWDRDRGAIVQFTGARAVAPIDPDDDDAKDPSSPESIDLPYVPGEDRLWPVGRFNFDVNDEEIIHPLGPGAEAYYTYSIGDSLVIRLPHGGEFHLVELRVNPRAERWNAVVGSLWLDRASAQIVRAAYRLASPLDIWVAVDEDSKTDTARKKKDDDDIPAWLKSALHPLRASLTAVTQEFALQGGQWWLPISRTAEGLVEVGPMRLPISWEERFAYEAVRGTPLPDHALDSLTTLYASRLSLADSAAHEERPHQHRDTLRTSARRQLDSLQEAEKRRCLNSMKGTRTEIRNRNGVRTFIVVPCDTAVLAHSADLPPSIYESSDVVFGASDRDELRNWAMSLQPEGDDGKLPPPTILYGLGGGLTRYNRVEGLSIGVSAEQRLRRGYSAHGLVRLGVADLHPGAELGITQTSPKRSYDFTAYHRLAVAGDYGSPFTLGASLSALLFGRDDGFYYRATGAELTRTAASEATTTRWRLFGEHHGDAPVKTNVSLAHLGHGKFAPNITAQRGDIAGLGLDLSHGFGEDPAGWRLAVSMRDEAAAGSFDYARGLLDATLSHPLPFGMDGALTGAAGVAGGQAPVQKLFFVGGPQTVRGIDPGSGIGDAFWLGRAELALSRRTFKPVLFGDLGWAGTRDAWQHPGRPLAGAGIGGSFLDGLVRTDIAKGIRPSGGVRVYLYLDARF